MAKHNKESNKVVAHIKTQRGLDRKRFFEEGGEMRRWIPARIIIPDKRKRSNKKACRGKWRG